jgi:hypothetical protein
MVNRRLRQLFLLIALYVALPSALISAMLVGWMVAVENATVVLRSVDSPDGRYRAEVVREDPGVSSGYEYMVRLMPADLTPLEKSLRVLPFGPVYVALDAHREPDKIAVQWTGRAEVTIHCSGCGETVLGKGEWRDIAVKYELE